MKKLITFLLCTISFFAYSQVTILNEDFESWPPVDFDFYVYGDGTGWAESWHAPSYAAHTGAHSAYAAITTLPADHWMVTPEIFVASGGYELRFWEKFDDVIFYGHSGLLISTGSGNPVDSDFVEIYTTPDTADYYVEVVIDLDAYAGQHIYVAWQYTGNWHRSFVDDVQIAPNGVADAALVYLLNPTGVSEISSTENVDIELLNNGLVDMDTVEIAWWINGIAQTPFIDYSFSLTPGQDTVFTIGTFFFDTFDTYAIQTVISTPADFNSSNDTLISIYEVSLFRDGTISALSPSSYFPDPGSYPVTVEFLNGGDHMIDEVGIEWKVDGIPQPDFTGTGLNLSPGASTKLNLGTYTFPSKEVYKIEATAAVVGEINPSDNYDVVYLAVDTFWESFAQLPFLPADWSSEFGIRDDISFDIPPHELHYYVGMADINVLGVAKDTLYTPLLEINPGDVMQFYIKGSSFLPAVNSVVFKDPNTGSVTLLETLIYPFDNWIELTVDLTAAAGINRIGIVSESAGYSDTKIDLIRASAKPWQYSFDLAITETEIDILSYQDSLQQYAVTVKNKGTSAVSGSDYVINLKQEPGVVLGSVAGVDLNSWETIVLDVDHIFVSLGKQDLYFEIEYPADEALADNRSRTSQNVTVPLDAVLVEIGEDDFSGLNFPFDGGGDTWTFSSDDISQSLWEQSEIGSGGLIYGIMYHYDNLLPLYKSIPLKVWAGQTNLSDLSAGWIDYDSLELYYSDTMEVAPGESNRMFICFDTAQLLLPTHNLVAQHYVTNPEWPPALLRFEIDDRVYPGPIKSISSMNYLGIDPADPPPFYNSFTDLAHTTLVMQKIADQGIVQGTVYEIGGAPIAAANLDVLTAPVSEISDASGNYMFDPLPMADFFIHVSATGYFDTTELVSNNSTVVTKDFYLRQRNRLEISGTVFGSNAPSVPLENVLVTTSGVSFDSAGTAVSGTFVLESIFEDATYQIHFGLYGYRDTTIIVAVTDSDTSIGTIILQQEFISPYDVIATAGVSQAEIQWQYPLDSKEEMLAADLFNCSWSYTNEPLENVWLGNRFDISSTTTITGIELHFDVWPNAVDIVTVDLFDQDENLLLTSEQFLTWEDTVIRVDITNLTIDEPVFAMLHWQDNVASTNALCIDQEAGTPNTAYIKYPGLPMQLLTDYLGSDDGSFAIRLITMDYDNPVSSNEVLEYNVFRGLADDMQNVDSWIKINTAPVSGFTFSDTEWPLDFDQEWRYAVDAIYTERNSPPTISNKIQGDSTAVSGIENLSGIISATVWPNPTKDILHIDLQFENSSNAKIELINNQGESVGVDLAISGSSWSGKLELGHLAPGMYWLKLEYDGKLLIKKIVVQ